MVVCNVAWQGDSTALPFSFSFFIARSSTVCGTQHQLLHVPRLLPKPNSPTLTLLLTPFVKISTPHNHHSSLTSAAEASPQSYYWGKDLRNPYYDINSISFPEHAPHPRLPTTSNKIIKQNQAQI